MRETLLLNHNIKIDKILFNFLIRISHCFDIIEGMGEFMTLQANIANNFMHNLMGAFKKSETDANNIENVKPIADKKNLLAFMVAGLKNKEKTEQVKGNIVEKPKAKNNNLLMMIGAVFVLFGFKNMAENSFKNFENQTKSPEYQKLAPQAKPQIQENKIDIVAPQTLNQYNLRGTNFDN